MDDNDYINEHLKNTLGDFRVQPRISSFDEVLKKMQKKKRRRFFFFLFPGLLILMGTICFFIFSSPSSVNTISSDPFKSSSPIASKIRSTEIKKKVATPLPDGREKDLKSTKASLAKKPVVHVTPISTPKEIVESVNVNPNTTNSSVVDQKNVHAKYLTKQNIYSAVSDTNSQMDSARQELTIDHLILNQLSLNSEHNEMEVLLSPLNPIHSSKIDSVKKIKRVKFFIGAYINPQIGAYLLTKNRSSSNAPQPFTNAYLKSRRAQNQLMFNYGFGIKGGFLFKDTWELLAGFGFQSYFQKSTGFVVPGTTSNSTPIIIGQGVVAYNQAPDPNSMYKSSYRYYDFSLGLSRIYTFNRFFKIKAGFGLNAQKLRKTSVIYTAGLPFANLTYDGAGDPSRVWLGNVNLKVGLIEDITTKMQFQVCPNLYCSPTSMFNRDYMIKQRNFGLGLECLLLFRLW